LDWRARPIDFDAGTPFAIFGIMTIRQAIKTEVIANTGAKAFARGLRDAFLIGALLVCAYFGDKLADQVAPSALVHAAASIASAIP
jgi:hypothetical protein